MIVFLTTFLPPRIGAHSTPAWLISREAPERMADASSIIMDRIIGIWVLLLTPRRACTPRSFP